MTKPIVTKTLTIEDALIALQKLHGVNHFLWWEAYHFDRYQKRYRTGFDLSKILMEHVKDGLPKNLSEAFDWSEVSESITFTQQEIDSVREAITLAREDAEEYARLSQVTPEQMKQVINTPKMGEFKK